MGKILTSGLKNKALEVYKLYPDKFSTDFDHNKQVLNELEIPFSKKVRNVIAGYLCRVAGGE